MNAICLFFLLFIAEFKYGHFVTFAKCPNADKTEEVLLETKTGKIKGFCSFINLNERAKSANVYAYLSVPYAESPTEDLRFKPPQPIKPWQDVKDGTRIPNSCMQNIRTNVSEKYQFLNRFGLSENSSSNISEDCLYLNIYSPIVTIHQLDMKESTQKAPIMVFFHGGEIQGSSILDIYNPSVFVAITNVIVITVNYRLDLFGFLHLNEDNEQKIDANLGILDQNLALKWIYENADSFGGDPSKITLMGHGSGAKLVGYHLIYEPSWSYFRNAILLSGSPVDLGKHAITSKLATWRAKLFLKEVLGCQEGKFIECLKTKDAHYLIKASQNFLRNTMANKTMITGINLISAFPPVVEGKMFKDSPIRSYRLGKFKNCSLITGFNANDGSYLIPFNYAAKTSEPSNSINSEQFVRFVKDFYAFYPNWPKHTHPSIHSLMFNEYKKSTSKNENMFRTLSKMLTDERYACPTIKLLNYMENKPNKVYLFVNSFRLKSSPWPESYGVTYGDELVFIFGHVLSDVENGRNMVSYNPWFNQSFSDQEKNAAKDVIARLASFIHNDDPNSKMNVAWPLYFQSNESNANQTLYLTFRNNGIKINQASRIDSCSLWNSVIPAKLDSLSKI